MTSVEKCLLAALKERLMASTYIEKGSLSLIIMQPKSVFRRELETIATFSAAQSCGTLMREFIQALTWLSSRETVVLPSSCSPVV